jgi:hypothetical protein
MHAGHLGNPWAGVMKGADPGRVSSDAWRRQAQMHDEAGVAAISVWRGAARWPRSRGCMRILMLQLANLPGCTGRMDFSKPFSRPGRITGRIRSRQQGPRSRSEHTHATGIVVESLAAVGASYWCVWTKGEWLEMALRRGLQDALCPTCPKRCAAVCTRREFGPLPTTRAAGNAMLALRSSSFP